MEIVKQIIQKDLWEALTLEGLPSVDDLLSQPTQLELADFTSNIAFKVARELKKSPQEVALRLASALKEKYKNSEQLPYEVEAVAGYINFKVVDEARLAWISELLEGGAAAKIEKITEPKKILLEFISANPTGPLTLANGRAGFFGDALANLWEVFGHKVHREYYVNDAGNQIKILGQSAKAFLGLIKAEEGHYKGEYIGDLAKKFKEQANLEDEEFGQVLAGYLLEQEIKPVINKTMGVKINSWISEFKDIRTSGKLEIVLDKLKKSGQTFEEGGALWLKTTNFGDDKDRVLIKADGEMTYFLIDIAYHLYKLDRGFNKLVTVLGADHFGYTVRLGASLEVLGYPKTILEIIILQLIRLQQDGQEVKMSKRSGNFVLMTEALQSVPVDLLRFYLLSFSPTSQVEINLDLLGQNNQDNPVYLVQYAHARIASILEKIEGLAVEKNSGKFSNEGLILFRQAYYFFEVIKQASLTNQPHLIANAVLAIAASFHKFYEHERVLDSGVVVATRLSLVKATKEVINFGLTILGITAPEKMIK